MKRIVFGVVAALAVTGGAETLYWRGGSSALASKPANWAVKDGDGEESPAMVAPQTGDAIVFDADSTNLAMTWDVDEVAPASWTQDGWAGTVTFQTGIRGQLAKGKAQVVHGFTCEDGSNTELRVTGDVTLRSGTWKGTQTPDLNADDHGALTGQGIYRLWVTVGGNLTVGADASVNLLGCGYKNSVGPGNGSGGNGNGASHGGRGAPRSGYTRPCYGNPKAPVTISNGGGALKLTVAGTTRIDGLLNVGYLVPGSGTWDGGAGGSCFLTTKYLCGSGKIRADGQSHTSNGTNKGGGGGGRVAVILTGDEATFDDFTGEITADGGFVRANIFGYAGTVYLEKPSDQGKGTLIIRGCGQLKWETSVYTAKDFELSTEFNGLLSDGCDYDFGHVVLTNSTRLGVASNTTVRVRSLTCYGSDDTITMMGGELKLSDGLALAPGAIHLRRPGSLISVDRPAEGLGTLTVGANGQIFGDCFDACTLDANLHVVAGGLLTHHYNNNNDYGWRLNLTVNGDLTIDAGGSADATRCGYDRAMYDAIGNKGSSTYAGGSKGDLTKVYGSIRRPTDLGASGYGSWSPRSAGALHLKVLGTLTNNGVIRSDASELGNAGEAKNVVGAAGSVWLEAGSLAGGGIISADGICPYFGSFASPGRVSVCLTKPGSTFADYAGTITARPGKGSEWGAGTVYLETADEGEAHGTLIIDAHEAKAGVVTPINVHVLDTEVGSVVITNGAKLALVQNTELKVAKDFENHGTFSAAIGDAENAAGRVTFVDGACASKLSGTTDFAEFICTAPGKTLSFATGDDNLTRIVAGGKFIVTGEKGAEVKLRGATEGEDWKLAIAEGAVADVSFADVAHSDASVGAVSVTAKDSIDSQNNTAWSFPHIEPGETIVWTGGAGSGWGNPANWDRTRVPVPTDVVVISKDAETMPSLADALTLNNLTVESGATLNLAAYDLTVTNGLTVAGALVASASEKIDVGGDVSFAGGSFTCANSTFTLSGNASATLHFNDQRFNVLNFFRDGRTYDVNGGFVAAFVQMPATLPTMFRFAAGVTVSSAEWRIDGGSDKAPSLTLVSLSPGDQWRIVATGYAYVSGVALRDSDASGGLKIYAANPSADLGNNDNWVFNVRNAVWVGGRSPAFDDPDNWSPAIVPDASARVVIESGAGIVLPEGGMTVRELTVVGADNRISGGPLTLANNLDVDGGELTLDAELHVRLDAVVRNGGRITHSVNATEDLHRVDLTVGRDLRVEKGSSIDADKKGFGSKCGPGAGVSGSYTQKGSYGSKAGGGNPYGSFRMPLQSGSGRFGDPVGGAPYAGGVVKVTVGGTLTVDGRISSNGQIIDWYAPSGGSVLITAGRLLGSGEIHARGGDATAGSAGGSGGRVALYLTEKDATFDDFSGKVDALGGVYIDSLAAPAGTVFYSTAEDPANGGLLLINNPHSPAPGHEKIDCVYLPNPNESFERGENDNLRIVIKPSGRVRQTADFKALDLDLAGKSAYWYLEDHTLKLISLEHRDGKGWLAQPDAGPEGLGKVEWLLPGLLIFVK